MYHYQFYYIYRNIYQKYINQYMSIHTNREEKE